MVVSANIISFLNRVCKNMKLCIIYNFAQHYRANIFALMDKTFSCDWVFGDSMSDVKKMDYSFLHGQVTETHTKHLLGGWYWQPGVLSQLFKDYSHYILLGETRALSTWFFCIMARLLKPKKKVYFWTHGWYGKENKLESFVKKLEFKLPNGGIFTYGNYARNLMIKEGFKPEKLFAIHNSLAYDQQLAVRKELKITTVYSDHFGNENPNLFFVGRLTPVKKLDQILRAMALCKNRGNDYNMTFVGGGEKAEELKQLAERLGLQDSVWFYGPCYDEKELSSLIYNADLCVAPGNIGLTAMHSMVFGTPCITHNDFPYQMPEFEAIKDGVTGTFFKRNDINDLAYKIDEWFKSFKDLREQVRKACMDEIDKEWNPYYQIEVLKKGLNY